MGTSTSSKGGGAGSPFDPVWLGDDVDVAAGADGGTEPDAEAGDDADGEGGDSADVSDPQDAAADGDAGAGTAGEAGAAPGADGPNFGTVAPDRRFASARVNMAKYLAGGGRDSLRAAAKSMVNRGMGGPRRAASTMRATSRGAGQLGGFLAAARDGTDQRVRDWVDRVRAENLSAEDLILEVVGEVLPDTGSIDDESLRNAAAEALGMLYEATPDIDIFALSDQQIADVIGYVIANDVCNRVDQQLGQTYERLKFDAHQIQVYRNDIKEFVRGEVRVVVAGMNVRQLDPPQLAREVLSSTLKVFSE
jgi:hypothetical protein